MKLPRRRFWIPLILVGLSFAFVRFDLHYHLLGWFRGDAYFRGMPTTYWRDVANPRGIDLPDWVPFVEWFRRKDWDERTRLLFSDPEAEPVLVQLAEDQATLPVIRHRALSAMRRWGDKKIWCSPEACAAARRLLADPDRELRCIAAHILLTGGDSEEARQLLLKEGEQLLQDPISFSRMAGIRELGALALNYKTDPEDIAKRLRPLLQDSDGRVREIASIFLKAIENKLNGMPP